MIEDRGFDRRSGGLVLRVSAAHGDAAHVELELRRGGHPVTRARARSRAPRDPYRLTG